MTADDLFDPAVRQAMHSLHRVAGARMYRDDLPTSHLKTLLDVGWVEVIEVGAIRERGLVVLTETAVLMLEREAVKAARKSKRGAA